MAQPFLSQTLRSALLARVSKDGRKRHWGLMVRDAASRLLTMRIESFFRNEVKILATGQ
jgi:hypothetical protein